MITKWRKQIINLYTNAECLKKNGTDPLFDSRDYYVPARPCGFQPRLSRKNNIITQRKKRSRNTETVAEEEGGRGTNTCCTLVRRRLLIPSFVVGEGGGRESKRERSFSLASLVATRNVRLTTQWKQQLHDRWWLLDRPTDRPAGRHCRFWRCFFGPGPDSLLLRSRARSLSVRPRFAEANDKKARHAGIWRPVTRRRRVARHISARVCLSAEKDLLEDIWPGECSPICVTLYCGPASSIARRFLEIPFSPWFMEPIWFTQREARWSKWCTAIDRHERLWYLAIVREIICENHNSFAYLSRTIPS